MPVEVALPVSYSRSYNNMPVLPLGTSKRRISDTSTYTSGSLASRRQIRQTLLERSTSLSSPTSSNAVGSSYSSRFTSYQSSSIRSLPSGPGPLDSSGKRLDPVYLENLRRGRFEVMSPSSSRSSSLPPSRLTRRESVIEISSSLKRDKEILLRSRDTTSPFRSADFIREGSIKRELDSFQREGSMKRDMESFRRGKSVEPIMYKREESYRMERESSVSRFSNFSSNNLASTLGRTKRTQSITDLTSGLDNKRIEDSNANSRYLDTLNSSIHDPYGTLPRRSRFRTESVEREERSLSRSRISESPLRSSRISESPARTRVNESPSRTRISESPSRARVSESPSRVRLSETPSRSLLLDSSISRSYLNESSLSRNLINESSPTKSIKNDSSSVRGFKNDNLSTRTYGKENLISRNLTNDKSSRILTNDISLAHSVKDDVSSRSFKSESLATQKVTHSVKDDVSPRNLKNDSSSTQKSTNENLSNRNFKTDTSSGRSLTNDSSSSCNFKNETSSSWSSKNDTSSIRNLKNETSSVCNLKNDSSSKWSSKNENLSAQDIKNEDLSIRSSKNDSSAAKSLKTDSLLPSSKNENLFSSKKLDSLPPSSKNQSTFSSKKTDNLSSSSKNETSISPKIINDTSTWTSKKDKPSTHDVKNENLSTWSSKNDSASTKSLKSENSSNWSTKSENSLTPYVKSETSSTWSLKNDISTAKSLKTDRSSSWSSKNDILSNRNLKAESSSSWSSKNDNLTNCNLKTDGLLPNCKNENISQTLKNDNFLSHSLKNDTSTHTTTNDTSSMCSLKTETSFDHKNDSSSNLKNDNLSSQNSTRILKNDNSVSTCINESTSRPCINENAIRSTTAEIPPRPRVNETPSRPRANDIAARPPRISDSPLRAKITDVTTTKYDINHNTTIVTSPTKLLPKSSSDYGSLPSYYSTKKDRFSSLSGSSNDGYESKTSRSSIITNGKPEPISSLSSRNEYNTIKSSNTSKESGGLVGLRNLGNTCFMNSVIQCLSNTEPILDYCLRDSFVSDLNTSHSSMKGALTKAFAGLLQSLWKDSVSTSVSPHMFKQQIQKFAPRFMGYSQQDAQEFLRCLLQGLHEDVNRVTGKPKPIAGDIDEKLSDSQKATEAWKRYLHLDDSKIVDFFVGQLKSTLKCTTCGHSSVTFDPFWDLSLPIPKSYGTVTLQECLNLFTKEEILDGDEKPTCSRCKKRERCLKSLTIQRFPKMLVIHLKRFSQERYRAKLTTLVDFPVNNLDLSNYAADKRGIQKATYNLYAVANHSGTTYGGHYTAYCKNPRTGEWYDFNDTTVTMVSSISDIIGPEAYLLFYEMLGTNSHL